MEICAAVKKSIERIELLFIEFHYIHYEFTQGEYYKCIYQNPYLNPFFPYEAHNGPYDLNEYYKIEHIYNHGHYGIQIDRNGKENDCNDKFYIEFAM